MPFPPTDLVTLPGGKSTVMLGATPTASWDEIPSQARPVKQTYRTGGLTPPIKEVDLLTRKGQENPSWLSRIHSGAIVIGGMSVDGIFGEGKTVSGFHDYGFFGPQHLTATVQGVGLDPTSWEFFKSQMEMSYADLDFARTAAHANIRAPEIELGVMVAEARESFKTLVEKYDKLVKLLITAGKKAQKASKPADYATRLSNEWLRMRFGVEPLMRDIQDLINLSIPLFRKRVREFGVAESTAVKTLTRSTSIGIAYPFRVEYTAVYTLQSVLRSTVFVDYEADNPILRSAKALGLLNPLGIIWEATRLSFVFDWLINVGQWIRSWSYSGGGDVAGELATSNRSLILSIDASFKPSYAAAGAPPTAYGQVGLFGRRWFERGQIEGQKPFLPTFQITGNSTNILDSLALLQQFFQGKR